MYVGPAPNDFLEDDEIAAIEGRGNPEVAMNGPRS